ncbi:MAG: molecular chaperone TorD family protein [Myxococcota bacterium]
MIDASGRAALYGWFSRLFVREIDDPFAEVLQGGLTAELVPTFYRSDERAAVRDPAQRGRFDADFTKITVVSLVPYGSFYLRDDARIEAGLGNPLVAFYRRYGFEVDLGAARALSPDHLGISLEFLSVLAATEAAAAADGRDDYAADARRVSRAFLWDHLGAWAPVYLLAVQRSAETELYRDGAAAALAWILTDAEGGR